jgi:hypothetical protein
MNKEALLDAIGEISDETIIDAKRNIRPVFHMKWAVIAACLVVGILAGALLMPSLWQSSQPPETTIEPQHFTSEQALADYLYELDSGTDYYYRLVNIPTGLEFDSFSSYDSYVDWWYTISEVSAQARFIYLRWYFLGNGQEWLNNDLSGNGAGRIEFEAGGVTYYYLLVDGQDVGWPRLYDVIWLNDGYLFSINIPEESITTNGELNESLLLHYTDVCMVMIDR